MTRECYVSLEVAGACCAGDWRCISSAPRCGEACRYRCTSKPQVGRGVESCRWRLVQPACSSEPAAHQSLLYRVPCRLVSSSGNLQNLLLQYLRQTCFDCRQPQNLKHVTLAFRMDQARSTPTLSANPDGSPRYMQRGHPALLQGTGWAARHISQGHKNPPCQRGRIHKKQSRSHHSSTYLQEGKSRSRTLSLYRWLVLKLACAWEREFVAASGAPGGVLRRMAAFWFGVSDFVGG